VDNLGALSGEVVDNLWINPVDNPSEDIYQRACYAGNKHTHEREIYRGRTRPNKPRVCARDKDTHARREPRSEHAQSHAQGISTPRVARAR
jgi:hypothetical protein